MSECGVASSWTPEGMIVATTEVLRVLIVITCVLYETNNVECVTHQSGERCQKRPSVDWLLLANGSRAEVCRGDCTGEAEGKHMETLDEGQDSENTACLSTIYCWTL